MTDPAQQSLARTAAALIVTVEELRKVVVQVGGRLDDLGKRADRQRLGLTMSGVGLTACLVLSILMLVAFQRQSAASEELSTLFAQQEVIRGDAVCPILAYLIGGYDPDSRAAGEARQAAEANVAEQRRVYTDVLHCVTPLVPPRSDLVTKPAG